VFSRKGWLTGRCSTVEGDILVVLDRYAAALKAI
jgi:hypothetical protein